MDYKSKEKKAYDMARGKKAEKEYAKIYSKCTDNNDIVFPTEQEDMTEHWDIKINELKIDVKAIKKDNENIHFIEFKNVMGNEGWLYGKSDGFAFETNNFWIEVKKDDLQAWVHEKCSAKIYGWDIYELRSRPNAKDLFTIIPTLDLCYIGKIKMKV